MDIKVPKSIIMKDVCTALWDNDRQSPAGIIIVVLVNVCGNHKQQMSKALLGGTLTHVHLSHIKIILYVK